VDNAYLEAAFVLLGFFARCAVLVLD